MNENLSIKTIFHRDSIEVQHRLAISSFLINNISECLKIPSLHKTEEWTYTINGEKLEKHNTDINYVIIPKSKAKDFIEFINSFDCKNYFDEFKISIWAADKIEN